MKVRRNLFKILALISVISLIGCSNSTEAKKEGESELEVAINAQPPTLDPHITTSYATRDVGRQIYETLVTYDSNYQIQPMLAESYEVNEDGKLITFHLRKGVTFHNGKEMKAEDVVASMNRWKDLSSGAKAAFIDPTFEVKDDYTVLFKLKEPSGIALSVLAGTSQAPTIMPKDIIESAEKDGVTEYVGTGPFQFEEWKQDQYIKLAKFTDYQSLTTASDGLSGKKEALVDSIMLRIVPDISTRFTGIQTGSYDLTFELPFDGFEQLNALPKVKPLTFQSSFLGFVLNKKEGVFKDLKIRQAVLAALNDEDILQAAFGDKRFYRLDHGLMKVEQTEWYSETGKNLYNQNDQEKAKKLLQEAGYNGEPVRLIVTRDFEYIYNSAVVIKDQLEKTGMTVELGVYDAATLSQIRKDPSAYEGFLTTFAPFTEPTQFIFLDSKNEWDGWTANEKIDDLLDQIRTSNSQEQSKKYFDQLQTELYEGVPIIKIGDVQSFQAVSKNVEGYQYLDGPLLWNVKKVQ